MFFLQRFFQLSQCSTHAVWFFCFIWKCAIMCHFTAESVGERDTIQHRCELISSDPGKRSKGKSFDLRSLSTRIPPSLVCSLETNLFEGWVKLGMMIMCDIFSAFFVGKENIWRNLIFLFFFKGLAVRLFCFPCSLHFHPLRCAKIDSESNRRSKRRLGKGSMESCFGCRCWTGLEDKK